MIKTYASTNLLELWLNTSFSTTWEQAIKADSKEPVLTCLETLLAESQENKEAIQHILHKREIVSKWQAKIPEFQDKSKYTVLWKEFESEFIAALQDPKMVEVIANPEKSSRIERLLVLQLMQDAVEIYDQSIKAMKNNPAFMEGMDKFVQSEQFIQMLTPYLSLMKEWVNLISEEQMNKWYPTNAIAQMSKKSILSEIGDAFYRQSTIVKGIRHGMNSDFDQMSKYAKRYIYGTFNYKNPQPITEANAINMIASTLQELILTASKDFNVASATIGSGASFERQFAIYARDNKISAEDLFTLSHQNIKFVLAYFQQQNGLKMEQLPQTIQNVCLELQNRIDVKISGINMQLTTIESHHPTLNIHYNIPLRNHSAQIKLSFNKDQNTVILSFDFYGYNRLGRLEQMKTQLEQMTQQAQLLFEDPPHYSKEETAGYFQAAWKINLNQTIPKVGSDLENIGSTLQNILIKSLA